MFFKKVGKIYIELYSIKERFNKIEIEMYSENESQLKRITKPPILLNQEESLVEIFKKYPCLFGKSEKTYKERDVFQKYLVIQSFRSFFKVLKAKNNITSSSLSSILI